MNLPPAVPDKMFMGQKPPKNFFLELVHFLNQMPCMGDIQQIRARSLPSGKTPFDYAFRDNAKLRDGHWYLFNIGGSTEMQFNVGLYQQRPNSQHCYVRIGVGWSFAGPWRKKVESSFERFVDLMQEDKIVRDNVLQILADQPLEIEDRDKKGITLISHRDDVLDFIHHRHEHREWIFIGRLLRRGIDGEILENPTRLEQVYDGVFRGFKPVWERVSDASNH